MPKSERGIERADLQRIKTLIQEIKALFDDCITLERIRAPVLAADGFTYDEQSMRDWLQRSQISPATGLALAHTNLAPNLSFQVTLREILDCHRLERIETAAESLSEHCTRVEAELEKTKQAFLTYREEQHKGEQREADEKIERQPRPPIPFVSQVARRRTEEERASLPDQYMSTRSEVQQTCGLKDEGYKSKTSNSFFFSRQPSSELFEIKRMCTQHIGQWEEDAKKGLIPAQALLGRAYLKGVGIHENRRLADYWLQHAATSNTDAGYWALGMCLEEGIGSYKKNLSEAFKSYQRAVELEFIPAQVSLGRCYIQQIGTPQDIKRGIALYQLAAARRYPGALVSLALCHQQGVGLPQNDQIAFDLLSEAAHLGHAGGLYYLGLCYRDGRGVEKNKQRAIEYLSSAFELGIESAKTGLVTLRQELKEETQRATLASAKL